MTTHTQQLTHLRDAESRYADAKRRNSVTLMKSAALDMVHALNLLERDWESRTSKMALETRAAVARMWGVS